MSVDHTETTGVSTPDLATVKGYTVLLLSLVMAALIGHRALSQLRITSRSSFALPAQRSPVRRSQQVSANSHSNAQQHGAFGSPLLRSNSSVTCASRCRSSLLRPACQCAPTHSTPRTQCFRHIVSECLLAPCCGQQSSHTIAGSGIRRSAGTQAAASLVRSSVMPVAPSFCLSLSCKPRPNERTGPWGRSTELSAGCCVPRRSCCC